MARGSSSTPSPLICLAFRFLTFTCLLISLIVLTTSFKTLLVNSRELKLRFMDVYAYRYVLFVLVIGMAYTLLQIVLGICHVSMEERMPSSKVLLRFHFYADKVMSFMQGTGTGAAFGATLDLTEAFSGLGSNIDKFFNKGNAIASFLLFAFLSSAVSSVFSSLLLNPRDPTLGTRGGHEAKEHVEPMSIILDLIIEGSMCDKTFHLDDRPWVTKILFKLTNLMK